MHAYGQGFVQFSLSNRKRLSENESTIQDRLKLTQNHRGSEECILREGEESQRVAAR